MHYPPPPSSYTIATPLTLVCVCLDNNFHVWKMGEEHLRPQFSFPLRRHAWEEKPNNKKKRKKKTRGRSSGRNEHENSSRLTVRPRQIFINSSSRRISKNPCLMNLMTIVHEIATMAASSSLSGFSNVISATVEYTKLWLSRNEFRLYKRGEIKRNGTSVFECDKTIIFKRDWERTSG